MKKHPPKKKHTKNETHKKTHKKETHKKQNSHTKQKKKCAPPVFGLRRRQGDGDAGEPDRLPGRDGRRPGEAAAGPGEGEVAPAREGGGGHGCLSPHLIEHRSPSSLFQPLHFASPRPGVAGALASLFFLGWTKKQSGRACGGTW